MEIRRIPKRYPTWTAYLAATRQYRYFVDIEGLKQADGFLDPSTAHYGIRDRQTGRFYARKTSTRTEVFAEADRLNGGLQEQSPTRGNFRSENISQGRLLSPNRKIKFPNQNRLSPTEWIERLAVFPPTAEELERYASSGQPLPRDTLQKLMSDVVQPSTCIDEHQLDAVAQQLFRKFKIKRGRGRE